MMSGQIYGRRLVTTWTRKKFQRSARVRKCYRAPNERRRPQTGVTTAVAYVDEGYSANTASKEKSLTSADDYQLVQKCTETEDALTSVEHDSAAAESVPERQLCQRTASSEIAATADVDEAGCSSPAIDAQQDSFQVVTAQMPAGSPTHTEDREVADFSAVSNESASSPSGTDWIKTSSRNHKPLSYDEVRHRLRGTPLLCRIVTHHFSGPGMVVDRACAFVHFYTN